MFGIIVLPPVADREPMPGEFWQCQDWQCPTWKSCERHHGRSLEYTAMQSPEDRRFSLLTPARFGASCKHYRRDKPRDWLKGWCNSMDGKTACPGCDAPECVHAPSTVVPFRRASTTTSS